MSRKFNDEALLKRTYCLPRDLWPGNNRPQRRWLIPPAILNAKCGEMHRRGHDEG